VDFAAASRQATLVCAGFSDLIGYATTILKGFFQNGKVLFAFGMAKK
jgi:hypothetical protein